ncbi:guanine nucleotide-binding protein subunit beta-like protein 1 [Latimeria chalumnae]|uniref:G protein subunit beta 1 like n=1 Tax=Latimeria chalumnae TaxID=7897 RepID=H3B9Y2_LATCH|nr:PREDICTED: guanine nucleotide-binding protein subunit beta-like protein 1 [Latimeria chalumnae]XP_005990264.1 PREDICTED: guanine nucleotide-binding protein subunit beta-like protein 1 [Latimeria chalumnae]XP_005990265.1 PREDICTED: guanine nucleotide-binding protein subunit beta-like protein 1 [Latimeria chalumnae]|eukprot:XP_005990263.1 PREDICTED: guanine nucleotide-binding protein subunit beta-like protein 1 [Latimeria chalumnae]
MAEPPPNPEFVLRGTKAAVNTLDFYRGSPAAGYPALFSGSANGLIHVWNLKTRRVDTALEGHNGQSVLWVQSLQGRESLLSQGRDLRLCVWDLSEGRNTVADSISVESVGFCQCALLEKDPGHWLLAVPGSEASQVDVLDLPSKMPVCTLKPAGDVKLGKPMCLKLWQPDSGRGPLLLAGFEDGSVNLWNISERKPLSRLPCHEEPVMSLDFDPEKAKGVSGSSEKFLGFWKLDELQTLKLHEKFELVNSGIAHVCIRQDRRILATAGWDCRVRIFGWKKLKPLAVLQYHTANVHCVAFSNHSAPKERLLAAGSKDQRISVWAIYN